MYDAHLLSNGNFLHLPGIFLVTRVEYCGLTNALWELSYICGSLCLPLMLISLGIPIGLTHGIRYNYSLKESGDPPQSYTSSRAAAYYWLCCIIGFSRFCVERIVSVALIVPLFFKLFYNFVVNTDGYDYFVGVLN